jgi:hypothetical protein
LRFISLLLLLFLKYKLYQYKAGALYREGSELSLKRANREQAEEEAGNHRGLSATEPPEEESGSYFFYLHTRGT